MSEYEDSSGESSDENSSDSSFSLISRTLAEAASANSNNIVLSDYSIFSVGDSIVVNKGSSVEETHKIVSLSDSGATIESTLANDHEQGAFVTLNSSSQGSTTVSDTSVVTDTLIVGDPDQSGEETVFSVENGNVAAEGDVSIQGDLDVQGSITMQGESVNNVPSSEIADALTAGLGDVAEALGRIEQSHNNNHTQGNSPHIHQTTPYVSPNYATDPTSPCPNTGYYLRIDECTNCHFDENLNQIGALAKELVEFEFDYITGEAAVRSELYTISGSLSGRLGELNTLINQSFCYTGCDGNPSPRLGREEGDILQNLYLRDYNIKQAQKLMRNVYDQNTVNQVIENSSDWIELTEGDTTIRRSPGSVTNSASNRIAMSKDFKALAEAADRKIKDLVYNYNMYGAQPRQVSGEDGTYPIQTPKHGQGGIYMS